MLLLVTWVLLLPHVLSGGPAMAASFSVEPEAFRSTCSFFGHLSCIPREGWVLPASFGRACLSQTIYTGIRLMPVSTVAQGSSGVGVPRPNHQSQGGALPM